MKSCSEVNERISLYIDQELSQEERVQFEEHIHSCSACKAELEDILQVVELCRGMEEEELPANFKEDLHRKLLEVKIQEEKTNSSRAAMTRFIRIFSPIAACLVLVLLVRGAFLSGMFNMGKASSSAQDMMAKSEMASLAGETPENGISAKIAAPQDGDANAQLDQAAGAGEYGIGFAGETEAAARPTAEDRSQAPRLTAGAVDQAINGRVANMFVYNDSPETQVETVKTLAAANGADELQVTELKSVTLSYSITAKEKPSEGEIQLYFLVSNTRMDAFTGALTTNFNQGDVSIQPTVEQDVAQIQNALATRLVELDGKIQETENNKKTSDKESLNKLKEERARINDELDKLNCPSDYTLVSIVIQKRPE